MTIVLFLIYPQRYCCPSILDIVQRVDILNCNRSGRQTLQKEVKDYAKNNYNIRLYLPNGMLYCSANLLHTIPI